MIALVLLLLDVIGSTFTWSAVQDRELRGGNVPQVQESWTLWEGFYKRGEINETIDEKYPEARLEFYSWINPDFFLNFPSRFPEISGFRSPLLGSLFVILLTAIMAFPLGVGAAIYMEEYGGHGWISRIIETNISNLAGVPSIIYGLLGLAIFVRSWDGLTGGRTVLAGALTMTLVSLPVIIVAAREAIRAVPPSIREASYAVGGSKWDTVSAHILPAALPGILTGMILSMSRAIGETAPLITIGALTYIAFDPTGLRDVFTVMPIQIYTWVSLPQAAFHHLASAGILILLVILLSMNGVAIFIRRKTERTW
ncbi:MAG TPA: phosphate ABC transporter permease PstA [Thermomicrobiales bacterium]|nr:phosphate ABC transporter permease PstA [Thermomicrobiales bacterium]